MSATVTIGPMSATVQRGVWSGDETLCLLAEAACVGVEQRGCDPDLDYLLAHALARVTGGQVDYTPPAPPAEALVH